MVPTKNHISFMVPEREIEKRILWLTSLLKEKNISLVLLNHPVDICYFTGSAQDGVLIVPADEEPIFYVKKSVKRAEHESCIRISPYSGRKELVKEMRGVIDDSKSIGISADTMAASYYLWLRNEFRDCRIVDVGYEIRVKRSVKSPWEIQQIRKAALQIETVFGEMGDHIRPGLREVDSSSSVEKRIRELGHSGTIRVHRPGSSLGILSLVSGDSALYPTSFDGPVGGEGLYPSSPPGAGWKRIVKDEIVMVDIVSSFNGYHTDHTRVFYTGKKIPERAYSAHKFCIEVIERISGCLRPGRRCSDVFREIGEWIEKREIPDGFMGYGENRVKFFGHGIGLELDELPVIAPKFDMVLREGMVVAVEPKAFIKGIGGVGIEETYIIKKHGGEPVCKFEKDIVLL